MRRSAHSSVQTLRCALDKTYGTGTDTSIRKLIPKSTRTRASGNNDSQGKQPRGLAAARGGERCGQRDSARAMSVGARAKGRQPPDAAVRATPSVVVSSRSRVVFRKTGCNCGCRRHKSVSQRELLLKRQ